MNVFQKLKHKLNHIDSEPEIPEKGKELVSTTSMLEFSAKVKLKLKSSKGKRFLGSTSSSRAALEISSDKKKAEEFFIRNGAILLTKQIESFNGRGGEPIKIFSEKDIYHGTNGYDPALIIGSRIATVYKGNLDDRVVAIKSPQGLCDSKHFIEFFLNQVTIKQQICHKNVVKLYGCCLETYIPMLVQEYMNSSLFDHLHKGGCWISWQNRLRISMEIAYALSYMHCAGPKPIVHRDIKSSSIFLDESLSAKLSNFGMSIAVDPEDVTQRCRPMGSLGYIDPEYVETSFVTEKCDVYSFGVVMVELLTGKCPNRMWKQGADIATYFVASLAQNHMLDIVDQTLLQEESAGAGIQQFSQLAIKCVQSHGATRPTMEEVVLQLRQIIHKMAKSRD